MAQKEEEFKIALNGVKVPVLTLDNKWYRLFRDLTDYPNVVEKEKELNELLKRQGKINTEVRDLKKVKKKLMDEIVSMADEEELKSGKDSDKKLAEKKKLIEDCNEKLDAYQEEIKSIPEEINHSNKELMVETCLYCYDSLHNNHKEIVEVDKWLEEMKEEIRQALIKKQSLEIQNRQIYSYMSEIFGEKSNRLFDVEE